jgi:required for meiotic nuclear division protein 1
MAHDAQKKERTMTNEQTANPLARSGKTAFRARALLLGDRIDLRRLGSAERLAADPFTIAAGACGVAVLFRYGAAVLFNVSPDEEAELLRSWNGAIEQPYAAPETESLEIRIDPSVREGLGGSRDIVEGSP